jgi:hypothetical protein
MAGLGNPFRYIPIFTLTGIYGMAFSVLIQWMIRKKGPQQEESGK